MLEGGEHAQMQCKLDFKREESIVITQYINPTRFRYMKLEDVQANGRIVNHIESQLLALCQADHPGKVYQASQFVVLRYHPSQSEKYMRGQVVNTNGTGYIVLTLDYGFLIQCLGQDLWPLPKNFRNIYIESKYGGLSDVAPLGGKDWSERAVDLLNGKLNEAQLLIFRPRYPNYGQLLIKSPKMDTPLLNAADYLIDNQCAQRDLKITTDRINETAYDLKVMELNEAKALPSKRVATVIRIVEMERIQLPLSQENPEEDKHQSRLTKAYHKINATKRSLTNPCMQLGRLDALLRQHTTPTIPSSAKKLSVVRKHREGSVEIALISGSSSYSSSGSNCSSDSFDGLGNILEQPAIRSKLNPVLPFQSKGTNHRKSGNIEGESQVADRKPTTNRSLLNISKDPLEKPSPNLPTSVKDVKGMFLQLKIEQQKAKDPQEVRKKDKLERILEELGGTEHLGMSKVKTPVKKVTEQSSTPRESNKSKSSVVDKEKLNRINNQHQFPTFSSFGVPHFKPKSNEKTTAQVNRNNQLFLAHSKGQVMPISGSPAKFFGEDTWMAMEKLNYQNPWPIQRYAWPHLMRGNTLMLIDGIGTGRSWSYLPMLCSLVTGWMRRPPARSKDTANLGPLVVILTESVGSSLLLSNQCNKLLNFYDTQVSKVINTHDHTLPDVQMMLLNSCGILVTTVSHLKLILTDNKLKVIDPHRLKYFIVDDYDRLLSAVPEMLHESLQLVQNLAHAQLQLILVAQRWHGRVFSKLLKQFNNNPLLLFGDFLVAAIYGNLKIDVVLRHSSKKTQQLIDYLSKRSLNRRTVIFCSTNAELIDLEQTLTAAGHGCIGLRDAVHQQSQELLLVSDAEQQPTQLPIRNFELLVHYSLPTTWSKFSYRFHAIIDNIVNCLVPEQKSKHPLSYVMLDENSSYELPRLAQFLQSQDIKLEDHIEKMVASCRQLTDQNRAFCSQLKSRGKCEQKSVCHKRHFTINEDFHRSPCDLWQAGTKLRCKIIKTYSPVHFAVLAEAYKPDLQSSWKTTQCQYKLRKLSCFLNVHMSLKENRRLQQNLKISDVCLIPHGSRYQRVRVVDLSDQRLVTVQLLDEGTEQLKVKPTELFECVSKCKDLSPLAMDVRICGLLPSSFGEGNWLPEATKWVNTQLRRLGAHQHVQLIVEFTMLDTVYVREISVIQECPTMQTSVKVMELQYELIRRKYGKQETQDIANLLKLHREITEQQEESSFKKEKATEGLLQENQWELLENLGEETLEIKDRQQLFGATTEKRPAAERLKVAFVDEVKNKPEGDPEYLNVEFFDRNNKVGTLKSPQTKKHIQDLNEANILEPKDPEILSSVVEKPSVIKNQTSTDMFMDLLLQDLQSNEQSIQDGAKQIMKEILADDNSVPRTPKRRKSTSIKQITPITISKALFCASIEGNSVRPKVRWHQTLMQIDLIFEQQVPQYELLHRGNVLIYQVLETTPTQRCILNLLGEVTILSEQQHGYQLHVKLAKRNLILYWPTLLNSLSAQQQSHWLVYDLERGKAPQTDKGRIMWLRYLRGVSSSVLADKEEGTWSDDELSGSTDED